MDIVKIVFLILIFAMMGFNVFVLVARGTDWASKIVEHAAKIGLDLSILSLKKSVEMTEQSLESSLSSLENSIGGPINYPDSVNVSYHPDRTGSDIQRQNKSGYCYIGKDKGFRSCIYAGVNDVCESNEIYPSKAICLNPSLRT